NLPFIYDEFGQMAFPWLPQFMQRSLGKRLGKRFAGYLPKLGITPKSEAAIEHSWLGLQRDLDAHFERHDYLFGGRPSIGDFGLIGPLYAHLYRDPYPGRLMREQAPHLTAWVERMQSPEPASGHFLADDEIPETIWPLLERMRREQVPVLIDTQRRLAEWHAENAKKTTIPRIIGEHRFEIEGQSHRRAVLPHSLWRWQRCSDYLNGLPDGRQPARDLAWRLNLYRILTEPPAARVARENNRFIIDA
ncbi:MAG: glutathione S-transferase C-terminal domain-containing protein, partial [Wenzhouxiangellaceae bacterium]